MVRVVSPSLRSEYVPCKSHVLEMDAIAGALGSESLGESPTDGQWTKGLESISVFPTMWGLGKVHTNILTSVSSHLHIVRDSVNFIMD